MKTEQLTPGKHREQIEAYTRQGADYVTYANALRRVLGVACAVSLPEAIVQARAKSIASFAEKCARKFDKYPDAVNQFTDLCGARVIVQTLAQVEAVCRFVERNFRVLERDDKATHLSADRFGYRDMHFVIQVPADCPLDFTPEERSVIGQRRAELQVRTWVQHAWADTLHDRMYKTPLRLSTGVNRRGNLLAAVMEEGDRGFDRLAEDLDGMLANYTAYASPQNVESEIAIQRLLLGSAGPADQAGIALKLAHLLATREEWLQIIALIEPHAEIAAPLGWGLRSELGHALCRQHRARPTSEDYRRGQRYLSRVISELECEDLSVVPNLRRERSVHARALARLGWSYELIAEEAHEARRCYAQAVEMEPTNPYYLAEMLGFELHYAHEPGLLASFRPTIRAALHTCQEHACSGTELPTAHYTAGRLLLLLEEPLLALHAYARGVRYCFSGEGIGPCDALANEVAWLHRINPGRRLPEPHHWVKELLELAMPFGNCGAIPAGVKHSAEALKPPVLIVAGGAASLPAEEAPRIQALLRDALADFSGTVLSGGTTSGVPGCLGAVAGSLNSEGRKRFHLRGYIPRSLPQDAEKDKRYDQIIASGTEHFSPEQILQGWRDVLAAGIRPEEVLLLGFGGGSLASFEYRAALALGATVGVVTGSGGAADALLKDALWASLPQLFPLPADAKTLRAFVLSDGSQFDRDILEIMAQEFHACFRSSNLRRIQPDTLKRWEHLPETYRKANREQAAYAIRILEAAGFEVCQAAGAPEVFNGFTAEEVELMAQLEHGRWNVDRLRDGWRPGPRDDQRKLHNCIAAWNDEQALSEEIKNYDRTAVRAFPAILAKAGLEVGRKK